MFASRRAERQQGFDAFAAKWERIGLYLSLIHI